MRLLSILPVVLLAAACGPGGGFQIAAKAYTADTLTAQQVSVDGKTAIDVVLAADPVRGAVDDEISVRVTLMWPVGKDPALNQDVAISSNAYEALVRVSCFCGGKDGTYVEPVPSGKIHLTQLSLDPFVVAGDFDLVFKGQIALASGGIFADDETLKVHASGFKTRPQ